MLYRHPTFRERSETVELAVEISLQPYRAWKPDGIILFSDILTPLAGMNVDFDIVKGTGPIVHSPVRSLADVDNVTHLHPEETVPFVGETLKTLRNEVSSKDAAVLGFVGAPWSLATYIVEGGSSKNYTVVKQMAFSNPFILHALLEKLTASITDYVRYQADHGAQAVQIFDSWGGELSPADFEVFSLPYIKKIVAGVRETHPDLPLILYVQVSFQPVVK